MNDNAFTAIDIEDDSLMNNELLRIAEDFAKKYNVFYGIYDDGKRYRVDLYFHETVFFKEEIESFITLLRASDMCTMSALPKRICMSCYSLKR